MEKIPQEKDGSGVPPETVTDDGEMTETHDQFIQRALTEYETPLVGYAMGFVHDLDRARDVVQDTFIRLCRQDMDKVRAGLKSWLFTVCRNRALDILRKEKRVTALDEERQRRTPAEGVTPAETLAREERIERVLKCMDRLSENQKTVILMKFRDGMSYKEITEATGLGGGNVGFLIHTGLKRLREWLPDDLMEGGDS